MLILLVLLIVAFGCFDHYILHSGLRSVINTQSKVLIAICILWLLQSTGLGLLRPKLKSLALMVLIIIALVVLIISAKLYVLWI